jgi:hypothetical protein
MDCTQYADEKLLDAYGELEREPEGYRRHVEACEACRSDLEELRELSEQYRLAAVERLPRAPRLRRRSDFWFPAAAAAALLVAVVAVLLWPANFAPMPDTRVPTVELPPRPLPAWDDDEALDREFHDLRRRIDRLERDIRRRNS